MNTLIKRFNFNRDAISNEKDGSMIDNFRLFYNHDFGGISGSEAQNNLQVFPKPFTNKANIRTKKQQVIQKIEVFSNSEQLVKEEVFQKMEYQFNKGMLEVGVNFIRCTVNNLSPETLRIVVGD